MKLPSEHLSILSLKCISYSRLMLIEEQKSNFSFRELDEYCLVNICLSCLLATFHTVVVNWYWKVKEM